MFKVVRVKISNLIVCFLLMLLVIAPLVLSAGSGGGGSVPTTACTQDTWSCSSWGPCQRDETQTRTCYLVNDCPNVETPKPIESGTCAYVSEILSSLKCYNLDSIEKRVQCRLDLTKDDLKKELEIAYLPEECRAISDAGDKEDCVLLYSKSQKCWSLPISSRTDCLKRILNLKDIKEEKQSCNNNPSCSLSLKKNVYALIKFRFYDLEERTEGMYKKGLISKEKAADLIASLEEKKIAFNQANSKEERKQIIIDTKTMWNNFISGLRK